MQLTPGVIDRMLSNLKIDQMNDLQSKALETAQQDGDLVLLAATGSGKTLAFLLPVLAFMDEKTTATQALVIVPSRELAIQIEQVFKLLATGFKVTCCYGGHLRETEENNLKEAPALIIGTPGRLADHIRRKNIHTAAIRTLVLDEFDKSLELGFQEEMAFVIGSLPSVNKRILTSATAATEIPDFVGLGQSPSQSLSQSQNSGPSQSPDLGPSTNSDQTPDLDQSPNPSQSTNPGPHKVHTLDFLPAVGEKTERLALQQVASPDKDKIDTLFRLICRLGGRSTIVFCNHRESVERVSTLLKEKGIVNVFYHGALEQPERDSALAKFRNGSSNVLVTTDLAARGLDVPNIRYIIHYHLPATKEVFTHRNGRTARMDASGTAILLLSPEESLPGYIEPAPETLELPADTTLPPKPQWTTLFISAGKKNKVNKVDVVGFFTNKGQLKKEDIGLIEVKDFFCFVALRKSTVTHTLQLIKNEKLKNQKVKIDVAK